MPYRLLITGAGSGEGNNLIRSLGAAGDAFSIVGCHPDRFILKKSLAARNYLTAAADRAEFAERLRAVIEKEAIDLVVPTSDHDTRRISAERDALPCRVFMPPHAAVELCQDKYRLATFLRRHGIPVARTYPVGDLREVGGLFRKLGSRRPLWCRIRTGSGSRGALPVRTPAQARAWMAYWADMRGVPVTSFTLSEYLPGRDFACQSVWKDGTLVLVKTIERLSYFAGWNRASGTSSTPDLAKTVRDPRVVAVCRSAVRTVDPAASGVFTLDLKEDADGRPCITEINIGRFAMITNVFDFTGRHNMAVTYVRLAMGEATTVEDPDGTSEGYYLVRDLDTTPAIFHTEELFQGIEEANQ